MYSDIGARRQNTANQHLSGHTSPDMCGYFQSDISVQTSPTKGLIFLRLFSVGDVNVTWCTRVIMTGMNFCCKKITFAWSSLTEEGGGWISFRTKKWWKIF